MKLTVPAPTLIDVPSCQGSQDGAIKLAGVTGGNVTSGATPLEGNLPMSFWMPRQKHL